MLRDLINRWRTYCIEENFIGIGSTRKVYRVSDYVIKVNLHSLGHKQSEMEQEIYYEMVKRGHGELFAQVFYVDENIAVQRFYEPLELINDQSYEIDTTKQVHLIPENYTDVFNMLDTEFDSFDLRDSSNYGLNQENKLVYIDYGMTKKLYENEWVPLAEAGVLPQIDFDNCRVCGEEKELRMYGDNDTDKRCYACGKE
ncbi:hypothetical protein [Paucisalibacillus sp. EB02]|uniref:hypothetical protein n=1 Tax=Paucisalibacillus sp. EB02 TaxID=1347087 RepID=UPI0004AF8EDA|nr:hypothetical protein [Paucisalibacillus sp. EB02]